MKLCFLDDSSDFEIPLFLEVFGDRCEIVAASNLDEMKSKLSQRPNWKPDLFVVDLYFPGGGRDAQKLAKLARSPLKLEDDRGEILSAYQNYLRAEARYRDVIKAWNQTPKVGRSCAEDLHARFPGVPIVFYSRKATFEDALLCMMVDGAKGIVKKPSGSTPEEVRSATLAEKETILTEFREAASKKPNDLVERIRKSVPDVIKWGVITKMIIGE